MGEGSGRQRTWIGRGRLIEDVLLVGACGAVCATVAAILGFDPWASGVIVATIVVIAITLRR